MISGYRINFSLLLLFSFFLHVFLLVIVLLPDGNWEALDNYSAKKNDSQGNRDIIVNMNQDSKKVVTKTTLLSDKDSSAKGHLSKTRGDRWLNNSQIFKKKSRKSLEKVLRTAKSGKQKYILSSSSEIVVALEKRRTSAVSTGTASTKFRIPDRNNINTKNSIYYSSSGLFSFNTAKFKNYKYFRNLKDKIASNWYTPVMANAIIRSYNGSTRINAIGNRKIKIVFYLDRSGDIVHLKLVDSSGMSELDESCVDAIKLSKNFGKLPNDIKGKTLMIPFIFGYYTR